MLPYAAFLPALGAIPACGGDFDSLGSADADVCSTNAPPATPALLSPADRSRDVVPEAVALTASAFSDPDLRETPGGADWEIWTITAEGALVTRVWHAELADANATVTLAAGSYDDPFTALSPWSAYAARVRHRDARAGCPAAASPFSEPARFQTDDGSAAFYDDTLTRDIYVEVSEENIDTMNAEAIPPGCVPHDRSYQRADVTIDGVHFEGAGLKVKGGCGSARTFDAKPGLKINLEWDDPAEVGCPGERRIFGQKHLTLNNQVQDRSAMHERLGYRLYRTMGVPVPRAAPVRVFVNGDFFGLYLNVETVDRRFLAHRFASEDGMLYEGTYWCDLTAQNVPPGDEDSFCLTREFAPDSCGSPAPGGDPLDYGPLRTLVDGIAALPGGGFYPEVEAFFDFDRFLSQWAVESVIGHWDNYAFDIMNNYRVYHEPADGPGAGRWVMIPTGIDQTFGTDQNPWAVTGVLAARCLAEPDCEAAFAARLREALAQFESLDLRAQADAIQAQIEDIVAADPRKEYNLQEWNGSHAALKTWIAARPARIEAYLTQHGF